MSVRHVLFAVHDWGLGHATRDLVLIRALLDAGHRVTVLSNGRALRLLEDELPDRCEFVQLGDIPKPLGRRAWSFYLRMSLSLPQVFLTFRRERRFVAALHRRRRFSCIVSDSRYGVCMDEVPSYYLVHSLRQIIPGRPRRLEQLVEASQRRLLSGARAILVPDQREDGLAGDLCHDLACRWGDRLRYIGILSSLRARPLPQDVDVFVSVSGAEPQRTYFERKVLARVRELPGRVVVALGRPEHASRPPERLEGGRIVIHGHLDRHRAEGMMSRARLVVTRSGYTTLMELAELGRRALLVPTVGQSEQEYLADRLERLGRMHGVRMRDLDLPRDVDRARGYRGLPPMHPTKESVDRFMSVVAD